MEELICERRVLTVRLPPRLRLRHCLGRERIERRAECIAPEEPEALASLYATKCGRTFVIHAAQRRCGNLRQP